MARGLDDPLRTMSVKFRDLANINAISLTYEEVPGGNTSDFWISISARLWRG